MSKNESLESVRTGFNRLGICDPVLLDAFLAAARLQQFEHDQVIIQAGDTQRHFFMIVNGLTRYSYLSPEGKQWNKAFFHEGQLIGSLSAYLKGQPCPFCILAVEPSVLAAIPVEFLAEHKKHPELQVMLMEATQTTMLRNEGREALLLTCDAQARYRWLLRNEAWLLDRVPQYHLASYLGMDAVSFSRVKNKVNREGMDLSLNGRAPKE